ncbi:hypothetical protein QQ020_27245 [Fulvivirgaceae bacterium BMA12]|uniref:Uncharacterized protein n=1 Tax=Agaribacillus aureus TaxID=3051825 RepID=A0ABT8LDE9_9BACT|nr:hypothetical protein [Fulvivirgaceae bacterium BMA12]
MNLNNLKPAWRQFRSLNAMERIGEEEILGIIACQENLAAARLSRFLFNTVMFIMLTICCQGG